MLERVRHGLTYANVMSTIAVVVAVGGGAAYAANTVFSEDIVNGEVKSVDIATGAVGTGDIADDAVNSHKILPGSVQTSDIGTGQVQSIDVFDNGLTGADINEPSLAGVDAATVDGRNAIGLPSSKQGDANEDSFATAECSSGCFHLIGNPSGAADFLDGIFKVESCADGGLMLNYQNQSSGTQLIRQVRHDQTGSFVTTSTFAPGVEGNAFFTSADQLRRLEAVVLGPGVGQARYDIYTEHRDEPNPEFSDVCSGTAYVSTIFND